VVAGSSAGASVPADAAFVALGFLGPSILVTSRVVYFWLVAGSLTDDLGGDLGRLQLVPGREDLALVVDDEHGREGHFAVGVEALDVDDVAFTYLGLLAAGADDRVHGKTSGNGTGRDDTAA